jgi:hypothetical protein
LVLRRNLARLERRAKLLEEALFMIMKVADAIAAHRTGGQSHEGDQAQHGKATARLLLWGLRIIVLISLGIRQGNAGAIDDLDLSTPPEVRIWDTRVEGLSGVLNGFLEPLSGQRVTGPTISSGIGRGVRWQPPVVFGGGHSGATRMILSEALGEEGFEGDGQRIEALGPGKGFGFLDQSSTKRWLIEESVEALEDGSQGPGFEVLLDDSDERN